MTKKLTREELRAQRSRQFESVSGIVLDMVKQTETYRAAHLADADTKIVHDTIASLEYVRTRVSCWPNLLLTEQLGGILDYLRGCTEAWKNAKIFPTEEGDVPMLPIVDIERLFARLDSFLVYSIAVFDDARYNRKPWWSFMVAETEVIPAQPVNTATHLPIQGGR